MGHLHVLDRCALQWHAKFEPQVGILGTVAVGLLVRHPSVRCAVSLIEHATNETRHNDTWSLSAAAWNRAVGLNRRSLIFTRSPKSGVQTAQGQASLSASLYNKHGREWDTACERCYGLTPLQAPRAPLQANHSRWVPQLLSHRPITRRFTGRQLLLGCWGGGCLRPNFPENPQRFTAELLCH